jgi:hypothetical protein
MIQMKRAASRQASWEAKHPKMEEKCFIPDDVNKPKSIIHTTQ